ncbi:phage head closure protein [Microbulbifer salipaludis]|uniref:Phage head closure protein n=1 Tax=Microbulbifer salipaludis TaxID=187980 RepID=A0ABS3E931_9GAMM|nr:phage head closure protein [Microbulbifer salipaludis]MBN8431811.1 phage head closure protein [Microbulbifer salipaludis]
MVARVKIGALRHRVTLQQKVQNASGTGARTETWTDLADIRAEVKPHAARELSAADNRYQETTHQVTIRYRPGVTRKMRVLFGGRVLEIETVINAMERNRWLHLLCQEIDP